MKNRKTPFIQASIFQAFVLLASLCGAKGASADPDKIDFSSTYSYSSSKAHRFDRASLFYQLNHEDNPGQLEKSTADLHSRDDHVFVGDFVESRAKVDFSYHSNYQLERQLFQDGIIHKYLRFGKSVDLPKIIFTAGVMGSGKGHVLKKMENSGQIHLQDYIWIDPDQLKNELPEMRSYIHFDPKTAGTKVHKESGFIEEIILAEALKRNKNIIVDGSLTSLVRHKKLFEFIRRDYPQYKIEIIHVVVDIERIRERIQKRGEQTGRFVPMERVEYAYTQVPKTVEALTPLVSKVLTIDNNEEEESEK